MEFPMGDIESGTAGRLDAGANDSGPPMTEKVQEAVGGAHKVVDQVADKAHAAVADAGDRATELYEIMTSLQAGETAKTLMIVEDEVLVAMLLRDELEDAGYHVLDLTARHVEALEVAKACNPDLALVNIRLAGRDDGIELAEHLKALGIPVLLISGQVSRARSAQTVAIASLPKPYDAADMVLAVAYLLARLEGDVSLTRPAALEVFDDSGFDLAPAA